MTIDFKTAFLTHQKSREGQPDRPRAEFTYEPEIDDLVIFVGGRDWVGNTFFDPTPATLDDVPRQQYDFIRR